MNLRLVIRLDCSSRSAARRVAAWCVWASTFVAASSAVAGGGYVLKPLDLPEWVNTSGAADINNAGQIAGWVGGAKGDYAVVWEHGTPTVLPPLSTDSNSSAWSVATGINQAGQVVGTVTLPAKDVSLAE